MANSRRGDAPEIPPGRGDRSIEEIRCLPTPGEKIECNIFTERVEESFLVDDVVARGDAQERQRGRTTLIEPDTDGMECMMMYREGDGSWRYDEDRIQDPTAFETFIVCE